MSIIRLWIGQLSPPTSDVPFILITYKKTRFPLQEQEDLVCLAGV